MPSTVIKLKAIANNRWALYSPNGNEIHSFRAIGEYNALEYARIYISTWRDWVIDYERKEDEKKD